MLGGEQSQMRELESMDYNQRATGILNSSITRWAIIQSFRRVAKIGASEAIPTIKQQNEEAFRQLLESDFQKILKGGAPSLVELEKFNERNMTDFQTAVDSASIVLGHSILDSNAYEFCFLIADISPLDWEEVVKGRKPPLSDIKGKSYDELLREIVRSHIEKDVERQSITEKVQRIMERCYSSFPVLGDYKYEITTLQRIDNLRNDIVHGSGPVAVANCESDLSFLKTTTLYLFMLLHSKYGIVPDPEGYARAKAAERLEGLSREGFSL